MTKILVLKIVLIGLLFVMVLGGGVLWMLRNKPSASIVAKPESNSAQSSAAENNLDENANLIYSVPILMYHYIRDVINPNDTLGANLSVSPDNFSKQLDYLAANNYQTISLQQLRDGFNGSYKIEIGEKPIVITFDDGYDDAYNQAYPILKNHGMIGVFYIITSQIGQSERMTDNQIVELDKAGMVIGSHTKNHLNISTLSQTQLNFQLLASKNTLESLLGHSVYDFCYPAGKYRTNDIAALKSLGYLTATTTKKGIADINSNLFELPRIRMQNDTNLKKVLDD